MKLSYYFLILLVAVAVVLTLLLLGDVPIQATGIPHPDFSTMSKSGTSVVVQESSKWLAYLFGLGVVGVLLFAVIFGARRNGKLLGVRIWLLIGGLAYLAVFSVLVFSYWNYALDPQPRFWGGLPIPTAMMLYGLGSVPLILSLVYIFKFKNWVLTDADERRFYEIVRRRKQNEKKD